LKGNKSIKAVLPILILGFLFNCSSSRYLKIAKESPDELLAMEDSLLQVGENFILINALTRAHNNIGLKNYKLMNYDSSIYHFSKSIKFIEKDTVANFYMLMAQGNLLLETGKKNDAWSAIQAFNKASQLNPSSGIPYYYIGLAYRKIGDKDFDLIIEAFQIALSLDLDIDLKEKTKSAYEKEKKREKKLNDFWR